MCPITNQVKGYPFEVPLPDGLAVTGVILADQVKSLHWVARQCACICVLPGQAVAQVLRRLNTLLDERVDR
jgi:mRNA interferase MazF